MVTPQCPIEEFAELLLLGLIDDEGPVEPRENDFVEDRDIASALDDAFDVFSD